MADGSLIHEHRHTDQPVFPSQGPMPGDRPNKEVRLVWLGFVIHSQLPVLLPGGTFSDLLVKLSHPEYAVIEVLAVLVSV
jgi:hypothetical protein